MAIVNAAMARRFWKDLDVVGRKFHVGGLDTEAYEIVGVVADYKVRRWARRRLVLRGGMGLVLVGTAAGLALAAGLSRFLSGVLYGLSAVDPIAFAGAALVLLAVALLANYVPAARASRLDPLAALRQD